MFRNYSSKKKLCFARSETKKKREHETNGPKKKPKQGENEGENDGDDLPNMDSGMFDLSDDDDEEEEDEESGPKKKPKQGENEGENDGDDLPNMDSGMFDLSDDDDEEEEDEESGPKKKPKQGENEGENYGYDEDFEEILNQFDQSLDETKKTQETKETKETKETEIPSEIESLIKIEKWSERSKVIKADKKLRKSLIKSETDPHLLQEYKKFKLSSKKELASLRYNINRMRSKIAILADPLPKTLEQVQKRSGVENLNLLDLNSYQNIIRKILKDGSYTFTPWISVPNLYYPDTQEVKVRGRTVELGTWKTYTNAVEILNFVCSGRRNANGNWWIQIDKEEEYIKLMGLRTRRSVSNNNYPIFYPPPPEI